MEAINGIAHTFLTAGNFARSREFYSKLLPFLGMKPVLDGDGLPKRDKTGEVVFEWAPLTQQEAMKKWAKKGWILR